MALHEAGLIVGVALASENKEYTVKRLHSIFEKFHEAGLGIEIHAGEWLGSESVWDALEYGYPDRIGHGISLFHDPKLLDLIRERDIHVEMCQVLKIRTRSCRAIQLSIKGVDSIYIAVLNFIRQS